MKILYLNAQSIVGKMNELSCTAADIDPDIILVCETWCNDDIQNSFLSVPGYDLINDLRVDRTDTHLGKGGGLLVLAKPAMCILSCDITGNFNQYCRFTINNTSEKWTITLVYRPPSSPPENCRFLLDLLDDLPPNSLLLGDFNYPYIGWANNTAVARGKDFLEKCNETCLEQLITFPTHVKGNILDLVLCNNPEKILAVSSCGRLGRSDHEMIVVELDLPRRPEAKQAAKPSWERADRASMQAELVSENWSEKIANQNTEEAWQSIKTKLTQLEHQHVPRRPWRGLKRPPWMNTELLRMIRQKRKLWSKYKKQNNNETWTKYKEVEKSVSKKIKKAKRDLEKKIANDPSNQKPFFSYIKNRTNTRTGAGPLKVGGETVKDNTKMAEEFNKYFSSVFQPTDDVPPPPLPPRKPGIRSRLPRFRPSKIK